VIEDRITKRVKDFEIELRTQETRLLMNKILQEEIDKSLETMTNQDWNKLIDSLIKKRILLSDVILRTKKRSPIATIMA
jgi:trans-2-enoyl-CoA reductase